MPSSISFTIAACILMYLDRVSGSKESTHSEVRNEGVNQSLPITGSSRLRPGKRRKDISFLTLLNLAVARSRSKAKCSIFMSQKPKRKRDDGTVFDGGTVRSISVINKWSSMTERFNANCSWNSLLVETRETFSGRVR